MNPRLCRADLGRNVGDCQNPVINPPYTGRNSAKSLWDKKCTQTITLQYDKGKNLVVKRESTHSVEKRLFCLITINNLSGVTQHVDITKN